MVLVTCCLTRQNPAVLSNSSGQGLRGHKRDKSAGTSEAVSIQIRTCLPYNSYIPLYPWNISHKSWLIWVISTPGHASMSCWLLVRMAESKSKVDFPCKAPRLLQVRLPLDQAKMPTQRTTTLEHTGYKYIYIYTKKQIYMALRH